MPNTTIAQAKTMFLESIELYRSPHTFQAYRKALETFSNMLAAKGIDPFDFPIAELTEDSVEQFVEHVRDFSPATESLYLQVIKSFYKFLDAEHLVPTVNHSRVRMFIRQRTRRLGRQPAQYPEEEMRQLIEFMSNPREISTADGEDADILTMHDKRDRALILTLADTGLRGDEICKLRCGDLDWINSRATLKGRGNKQAFVRFSTRAIKALGEYLTSRASLDKETGQSVSSLPLFARHDKGAGRKIKPITTTTIRNIVTDRVQQLLGPEAVGRITPHTFLHHFVTTILRATGNLKLAQVLARHTSIQVTQKYAHISDEELNKGYNEIFESRK